MKDMKEFKDCLSGFVFLCLIIFIVVNWPGDPEPQNKGAKAASPVQPQPNLTPKPQQDKPDPSVEKLLRELEKWANDPCAEGIYLKKILWAWHVTCKECGAMAAMHWGSLKSISRQRICMPRGNPKQYPCAVWDN